MKKKRKLKTRTTNSTQSGGGYGRGVLVVGRFSLRDTRARHARATTRGIITIIIIEG